MTTTHPDHYYFANPAAHSSALGNERLATEKLFGLRRGAFAPTALTFRGRCLGPVADYYFEPPRYAEAIFNGLLNELRPGTDWRTPRAAASAGAWPSSEETYIHDNGKERVAHNALFSTSFYLHPTFGTGHILRTDGRVAAFWNGERCYVVHFTNLRPLRVRLDTNEHEVRAKRKARGPSRAELLAMI